MRDNNTVSQKVFARWDSMRRTREALRAAMNPEISMPILVRPAKNAKMIGLYKGKLKMQQVKAPNTYDKSPEKFRIFLGGTIDNGNSADWQADILTRIKKSDKLNDVIFLNPRRDDWDPKAVQSIDNPVMFQQMDWEYNALMDSDLVLMVFLPGSLSPISLLELGFLANNKKVLVYCPPEYFRKANVDYMAYRYSNSIMVVDDFPEFILGIDTIIECGKFQ